MSSYSKNAFNEKRKLFEDLNDKNTAFVRSLQGLSSENIDIPKLRQKHEKCKDLQNKFLNIIKQGQLNDYIYIEKLRLDVKECYDKL